MWTGGPAHVWSVGLTDTLHTLSLDIGHAARLKQAARAPVAQICGCITRMSPPPLGTVRGTHLDSPDNSLRLHQDRAVHATPPFNHPWKRTARGAATAKEQPQLQECRASLLSARNDQAALCALFYTFTNKP
jgi:hypothetical protein